MPRKERVIVAMSGGVDSSVAAALLVQQGYECIGVTMQLWSDSLPKGKNESGCCSLSAAEDARRWRRARHSVHVVNFSHDFSEGVIRQFVDDYLQATPNPCIVCNEVVKFGILSTRRELDATYVALATTRG